jgi:hypothetical protein
VSIFIFQVAGGALLLANRFVPLALILLGPIVVNILLFHSLMERAGLPLALVTTALWITVFLGVRHHFAEVFAPRVRVSIPLRERVGVSFRFASRNIWAAERNSNANRHRQLR